MTTATQKIPAAYKQTEIGMIPLDWDVKKIEDIASIDSDNLGSSTSRNYLFKYIALEDVNAGILRGFSEKVFHAAPSRARRKIKRGDVLFGTVRPNLQSHLFFNEEGSDWICSTGFAVVRSKAGVSHPGYIFAHFFAHTINHQIDSLLTGSNYPAVNSREVKNLKIQVPGYIEQSAIATALSDADILIEKLERLIEKKKNIKLGTMQELLTGKRRLSGFSGKWETKKLGELLDYEQPTKYLVKDTDYSDNHNTPVLTAGKTFVLGYTAEETGIFQNLPTIIFDDFTTAIKYVDFPFKAKSSAMKMLIPRNKEVNMKFVFAKMQLIDFQLGDHKRYWISEYQNIEIATPKPDEQTAIASVLSDMDTEIEKLESQLTKYQNLKQGMMQVLLTGKTRLLAK